MIIGHSTPSAMAALLPGSLFIIISYPTSGARVQELAACPKIAITRLITAGS